MATRGVLARFEGFELDLRSGELRPIDGNVIRLSEQPFRILVALLEHPGAVVLREEIRKKLWPNDTVVEFKHSISAAINRLRQALGDSAENRRYIETLARRGYRWLVPVEWIEPGPPSPATGVRRTSEILTGKRVSHYRLLEVLGGGGMGVVYKAEDVRLGRQVAIKFLTEELIGNERALERFQHEARVISALDHPNICTIYEVEEDEGRPFIVMQLLQGETLRQRIESSGSPLAFSDQELLDIASAIANGLDAAHQKGIIHRDIKPANIFITQRGEIKLLDFGLAKLVGAELPSNEQRDEQEREPRRFGSAIVADPSTSALTVTGATMGTASYMSPEQVRKEPLDARTDLFSFGAVFYEMATGEQPFCGNTTDEIQDLILNQTPPSPRVRNPSMSLKVEAIMLRALEKDRTKRYQSAAEIISDLERAGPRRSGRPHAGVGIAAFLLLALAGAAFLRRETRLSPMNMEIARLTDRGASDQAAISPDGRYVAYSQQEESGVSLWLCQIATGATRILPAKADEFYGLTFSPDGNYIYFIPHLITDSGWHSLYVMPTLGGPPRLLIKNVTDSPISFSPDGQHFAFTTGVEVEKLELQIAHKDGNNRLLAVIPDGSADFQPGPAWSPDGRTIAVAAKTPGGFALEAISLADSSIRNLYSNPYGIGRPVWLSGDRLVVPLKDRSGRGQLWTMSYPRVKFARLTNDLEDYREFGISFSPESKTLEAVVSNQFANAWVAPATSPSDARQLTFGKMSMLGLDAGVEDKMLTRTGDGKLWIMNGDGGHRIQFTDTRKALALAACGRFVFFESYTSGAVDLMRVNDDGTGAVKLVSGDIGPPVCLNDSVYYTNRITPMTIQRTGIQGGGPVNIAKSPGLAILGRVAVSPDARLLAFVYDEAAVRAGTKLVVIPSAGGPILKRYSVPKSVSALCWSPDGQRLQYLVTSDPVSNIWEQPLDSGPPRQLTKFASGRIFDFDWSRDGRRLLLARGEVTSDVVLLSHIQ